MFEIHIDWTVYGIMVREKREETFGSRERCAVAIEDESGVWISPAILIRIEDGIQKPSVERFFAINQTLWGDIFPVDLFKKINMRYDKGE